MKGKKCNKSSNLWIMFQLSILKEEKIINKEENWRHEKKNKRIVTNCMEYSLTWNILCERIIFNTCPRIKRNNQGAKKLKGVKSLVCWFTFYQCMKVCGRLISSCRNFFLVFLRIEKTKWDEQKQTNEH